MGKNYPDEMNDNYPSNQRVISIIVIIAAIAIFLLSLLLKN